MTYNGSESNLKLIDCVVPVDCFTNVSQAPQNILAKIHNTRNHIYGENFNLKICTCAQSKALGTRTKFQIEILITSTICAIHKFRENFFESSRNVSETTPRSSSLGSLLFLIYNNVICIIEKYYSSVTADDANLHCF